MPFRYPEYLKTSCYKDNLKTEMSIFNDKNVSKSNNIIKIEENNLTEFKSEEENEDQISSDNEFNNELVLL